MSDVTIAAQVFPDCHITGLGNNTTGTCGVTSGDATVTFATALPARFAKRRGYNLKLGSVWYTVLSTAEDKLSVELTVTYAGSTNVAIAYILPPAVDLAITNDIPFTPNGSTIVQAATPVGSKTFYKRITCSVRPDPDNSDIPSLFVPSFTLAATSDIQNPIEQGVRYHARLCTLDGTVLGSTISNSFSGFESFVVPATPTSTTWSAIRRYSNPGTGRRNATTTYTDQQINGQIDDAVSAGIDVAIDGTANYFAGFDGAHSVGNAPASYDSSLISWNRAVDFAMGVYNRTAAQIAALAGGNKGRTFYQTDGIKGFKKDYGSTVGIRQAKPYYDAYEIGLVPDASGSAAANQTAWQAFHDAAPSSGAMLRFPEGTFYFTTGLACTKPIQIVGAGANFWNTVGPQKAGTTILVNDGASGVTFTGQLTAKGGRVQDVNIKTLTGFSGQTTGYGIWTDATVTVQNVSVSGFAIDGIFFAGTTASSQNSSLSRVDTVHVFDVKRDGIHMDGGGDSNVIILVNPNVTRAGRHGIYDAGTNNRIDTAHVNDSAQVTASSYDYFLKGSSGVLLNVYSELGTGSEYIWFDTGAVGYTVLTGITGAPTISGVGSAVYDNHYIVAAGYQRDLNLKDTTDAVGGHNYRLYSRTGALWTGGFQIQDLTDSKIVLSYEPTNERTHLPNVGIAGVVLSTGTPQALSGAGAVNLTTAITHLTTTGANALTLANGTSGQEKEIICIVNAGTATLTPTSPGDFTNIQFTAVGQSVRLRFTNGKWYIMGSRGVTIT